MHLCQRNECGNWLWNTLFIVFCLLYAFESWLCDLLSSGAQNKCAKFLLSCLKCCFWCLEKFIKFINRNAYIMVRKLSRSSWWASNQRRVDDSVSVDSRSPSTGRTSVCPPRTPSLCSWGTSYGETRAYSKTHIRKNHASENLNYDILSHIYVMKSQNYDHFYYK